MERDPQKVSSVLADPTRYNIYQYVLSAPQPLNAAEVAEHFSLHPNVARSHLSKLVDIGLVVASAEKTGKGGRPGYVYWPSGSAVSLTVPARDFQLLADLLVQSLALTGEGGMDAIVRIGQTFGKRLGKETVQVSDTREQEELIKACSEALHRLGVMTHVTRAEDGSLSMVLKTCGFREVATAHPEQVCLLCKAMVEGITQAVAEVQATVTQSGSVPRGDKECVYEVEGLRSAQP
ncbi:MAG TPA: helix-turn-helix domain-containing protein [Symbiobacteriaceae bacterium]|nr:helix-turn-helix domain-containing protein [Symbiobacteriaceae bacterium]